ncbi:MAG TPA: hypothetical protein PLV27_00525 [Anaerolineaceae bacterium]|nr:hypothetical protein [Anaerolineaceae bacterium]
MTIAISIKVNNGIVLATDSAASITAQGPDGQSLGIVNVYQNAEKLFNLCKKKPIGVITWGTGSIGRQSISTVIKDYRNALEEQLDQKNGIDIQKITEDFSKNIFEKYKLAYKEWKGTLPQIGFLIAGYSTGNDFAEEWKFEINNGQMNEPEAVRGIDQSGMVWNGEPEAISRILVGTSPLLPQVLKEYGLKAQTINEIIMLANNRLTIPFIIDAMPIKDAIDLAKFFVELTINFSKFRPGAPTVNEPIDIAAITKHEGFKWVSRKYYYSNDINPV